MNAKQIGILQRAFSVKRYHVVPTVREQTVGDHTARVIALVYYLTNGKASRDLVLAALEHDGLEGITGDIPATAKWIGGFGEVVQDLEIAINKDIEFYAHKNLTPEEMQILKLADILELCCWSSAEVMMGNQFMKECFFNGTSYISKMNLPEHLQAKVDTLLKPKTAK